MKKQLLFSVTKDDFDIQTFTCSGHGGAGKDTSNNGIRLIHRASGAKGEGREHRRYSQNRESALKKLLQTKEWKAWHKLEVAKRLGQLKDIDAEVDKQMSPENLKVEYWDVA